MMKNYLMVTLHIPLIANNFGATWIDLKVMGTNEISLNIKIAFQIEEGSFPNFAECIFYF